MESFKEIGRQFSAINMAEEYRRSLDSIQNIAKSLMSVTIIENTNYYYKVTFTDEDGVQREGYVAKRNLKIIKEPEAEETEEKLPPEE